MAWSPKPEAQWRDNSAVEEARKLAGWVDFHKACGRERLYFDHIEKQGRDYVCTAFTGSGTETRKLCDGSGKTVVEALEAAFRTARVEVPDAESALARMKGEPEEDEAVVVWGGTVEDDFAGLLATDEPDDFEELLS